MRHLGPGVGPGVGPEEAGERGRQQLYYCCFTAAICCFTAAMRHLGPGVGPEEAGERGRQQRRRFLERQRVSIAAVKQQ